jgi:hypothetical protein
MSERLWGVVVSDVVGSSATRDLRAQLGAKLRSASTAHFEEGRIRLPYAVTAGDEFQTIASELCEIPGLVFELRRRMRPFQLRIGIGIGLISGRLRPPVNQLGGQAFAFSRTAMEETKERRAHTEMRTRFHSQKEEFNLVANLIYGLHDALVAGLSEKQWETVDAYLATKRVDLAAKALRINASTASRNLRRSHFWYSLETISSMKKIIDSSFPEMHGSVPKERIA